MKVSLHNLDYPEYGMVEIVLPIPNDKYDQYMAELEELKIGSVTAHDCYVDLIEDGPPALEVIEGTKVNIDELDFLARSLDRFDDLELAEFQCMVGTRDHWDMQTLINLSFSCSDVTVITDFSNLESVGINHYLTMKGGAAPTSEVKNVRGIDVAKKLIATQEGIITPYGVVYDNSMLIEQLYHTGRYFPQYQDQDYLEEVELNTPREGKVSFYLPQPEKRLERLLERACIFNEPERVDGELDGFCFHNESVFELNKLYTVVQSLDKVQRQKLIAVMEYAKPQSAFQARALAENLDDFDFAPGVRNAGEYGRFMIEQSGHFDYDPTLDEYYDYEKYGRDHIGREEGRFSVMGYVSYKGMLSLDELMMQDCLEQSIDMEMGGMA